MIGEIITGLVVAIIFIWAVRSIGRWLHRYHELQKAHIFDGNSEEVYRAAESKVIKERAASAWK